MWEEGWGEERMNREGKEPACAEVSHMLRLLPSSLAAPSIYLQ